MNIDIYKFNGNSKVLVDQDVTFPSEYTTDDISELKNIHVSGYFDIDEYDNLNYDFTITGTMVLKDSLTLEAVDYDFESICEDSAGNYENYLNKNRNLLDILPILWENIVSEVPIQVKNEGSTLQKLSGNGWEFESNE